MLAEWAKAVSGAIENNSDAFFGFDYGLAYLQQGHDLNQRSIWNINGALFLVQAQVAFGYMLNVLQNFPMEFPLFIKKLRDPKIQSCCKSYLQLECEFISDYGLKIV